MVRQVRAGESPLFMGQTSHISNSNVLGEESFILEGKIFCVISDILPFISKFHFLHHPKMSLRVCWHELENCVMSYFH